MEYLRSDCILREILEERKSLSGFLDAIFGFLSRNTDFYRIQKTIDDTLGFPKGVKEQILMSCLQKYEQPMPTRDLTVDMPSIVGEEVEIITEKIIENECTATQNIIQQRDTELLEISKDACHKNILKFNESEYKNGFVFDNYCWSQSMKDVELSVLLPKEVKLAKHIKIELNSNKMTIKVLVPKKKVLISAETWDKYRHNDVLWSITDGKLVISFDKLQEIWWDKLFVNENAVDIQKLETERTINEYSQDTQTAIEKLCIQKSHQEQQDIKTLPLNKSEQLARLRQAWNADGSPFKGQPFDPTVIQFN